MFARVGVFFSTFFCWSLSQIKLKMPPEGLVYDYRLDDAGISSPALEEDEEEELKSKQVSATAASSHMNQ